MHSNNSSSTCSLKNAADFQNPDKVSGNLLKDNKLNRDILSEERESESMSVSNVADIPSTVKLVGEPIPVSVGHKTTGSLVTFDANLEQNKSVSDRYPNVSPLETPAATLSKKSKPVVDFVEPAVIRESAVSRNSMKSPSIITVRDKSYKLLNILGKGGSSVVYQVNLVLFRFYFSSRSPIRAGKGGDIAFLSLAIESNLIFSKYLPGSWITSLAM